LGTVFKLITKTESTTKGLKKMKRLIGLFAGLMLATSSQVFAYTNDFNAGTNGFNAGVGMLVYYDANCSSMLPGKMVEFEQISAQQGFPKEQWATNDDATSGYIAVSTISCRTIWEIIGEQGTALTSFFK